MIDWIPNGKVQNLKHLLGDNINWILRREWPSFKSRKSWCPLSPPYTGWLVGRSFVVCGPHGSSSGCYKWMSPRCWIPGSAANAVPAAEPVVVVLHGHTDAESNQQLSMMYPIWRPLCQNSNAAHHCHHSFGATTHRLHEHWDHYEVGPTTKLVNILVFCDHITKHVMAYMTSNQTAKTFAKFLWQGYISIFGTLTKLLSNWDTNVDSNGIKELCKLMDIWKVGTSPYYAQTNRQVEWPHQNAYAHDKEA